MPLQNKQERNVRERAMRLNIKPGRGNGGDGGDGADLDDGEEGEGGEREEEGEEILADRTTGQPKVVQEVLADLKTGLIDRNN